MAVLIGDPKDVIEIIKLVNSGNDDEAQKKLGLRPNTSSIDNNDLVVDKFINVANTVSDTSTRSGGVLVHPSMKRTSISEATKNAAQLNQLAAEEVSNEAIAEMSYAINEEMVGPIPGAAQQKRTPDDDDKYNEFLKTKGMNNYPGSLGDKFEKTTDGIRTQAAGAWDYLKDSAKNYYNDIAPQVGMLKKAGEEFDPDAFESGMKDRVSAAGDIAMGTARTMVYGKDAETDATARMEMNKGYGQATAGTIRTNELYPLTKPEFHNNEVLNPNEYDPNNRELANNAMYRADKAESDPMYKYSYPDERGFFGKVFDSIKNAFSKVPEMLNSSITWLKEVIVEKKQYFIFISVALVAAFSIYAIYKLYKFIVNRKGQKVSAAKAEVVDLPDEFASESTYATYASLGQFMGQMINESVDPDNKSSVLSKYITGAADAASVMFSDPEFKQSKLYPHAERSLANLAVVYDEYLQDLSSL